MTFLFVMGTSIRCTPSQCQCICTCCSPMSAVISGLPDAVGGIAKGRFDVLFEIIAAQSLAWVQIYSFPLCREARDQGRGEKEADPWSTETALE